MIAGNVSSPDSATTASSTGHGSGGEGNRTLDISLGVVLSVVGLLLMAAAIWICVRCRRGRLTILGRGISPIDDDEIARWKVGQDEKGLVRDVDVEAAPAPAPAATATAAALASEADSPVPRHEGSSKMARKPPSVIVYHAISCQDHTRRSQDTRPSWSAFNSPNYSRTSFDKECPQTPIQARAPNARAGLTDEAIPGDDPFVPPPKRHSSRLHKRPPSIALTSPKCAHSRSRSSRSNSMRSFAEYKECGYAYGCGYGYGYGYGYGAGAGAGAGAGYSGSEQELSPVQHSHDHQRHGAGHSRVYSTSSIPPRLSLRHEDVVVPPSPRLRNEDIGRAIG